MWISYICKLIRSQENEDNPMGGEPHTGWQQESTHRNPSTASPPSRQTRVGTTTPAGHQLPTTSTSMPRQPTDSTPYKDKYAPYCLCSFGARVWWCVAQQHRTLIQATETETPSTTENSHGRSQRDQQGGNKRKTAKRSQGQPHAAPAHDDEPSDSDSSSSQVSSLTSSPDSILQYPNDDWVQECDNNEDDPLGQRPAFSMTNRRDQSGEKRRRHGAAHQQTRTRGGNHADSGAG